MVKILCHYLVTCFLTDNCVGAGLVDFRRNNWNLKEIFRSDGVILGKSIVEVIIESTGEGKDQNVP